MQSALRFSCKSRRRSHLLCWLAAVGAALGLKKIISFKQMTIVAAKRVISSQENAAPQRYPQTPHLNPQEQRPETLSPQHCAQAVKEAPVLNS